MRWLIATSLFLLLLTMSACSRQETVEKVTAARETAAEKLDDVAVPWRETREDPKQREAERFDEQWRELESFRAQQQLAQQQQQLQQQQQQQQQQAAIANLRFVPAGSETLKGLSLAAINTAPIAVPIKGDVSGPSVLKTQVYLDRLAFSVGALDGRWGRNSSIALWWFQRSRGLDSTGAVDEDTFRALAGAAAGEAAVKGHTLTAEDVKGPFNAIPEDVYDKAKLDCLCYETLPEKIAERFHTTVELLESLNPGVQLSELTEGASITVPNVRAAVEQDQPDIAKIVVSIAGSTFNAFDASGNLVFHAPTTLGSEYDPSPNETLSVTRVAFDPPFHYQPKLFQEVSDDEPEANLNPGPNSPVGVVWIALSKKHFGIHGTSDPESIGYASSHGCVRLTNWDAREIAHRVRPDVPVEFVDTRKKG